MSSNHLGARSKIRVQPESNSRKGKKKGQSSNSCWDDKKLWEASTEQNQSSRNASMDTWDNVPTNIWNKKDSWEESMRRKKKEPVTVWGSIEQEFPSLGDSQQASRRNVWTERQRKFEEVKSLEPANEAEEEKMIRIALEMSKFDVESDEAKRKRLQEEYLLQEEMLKANPDYFKDFVPVEELCNNTSNNNNWDTWNDYSNFGIKNDADPKNTSGWNDSSLGKAKSTLQTNSKVKDYESVWGIETDNTNSDNWNYYLDSGSKEKSSIQNTSNCNSVGNVNGPLLKATQQSKSKTVAKNEDYDGVWGIDNANSGGWNNYSDLGAKKTSTSNGASSYISDSRWNDSTSKSSDGWNDYSGASDKKDSTAKGATSYRKNNPWDNSTGKSEDGWNDYSNSVDTKASLAKSASNYKNDNSTGKSEGGWNDYSNSDDKKTSVSKSALSYKSDTLLGDSTGKEQEQLVKKSSMKYDKCDEIWSNDADNNNSDHWNDNAEARDKRNYFNFKTTSSHEDELVSEKTEINGLEESKVDSSDSESAKIGKNVSKADSKKSSSSSKSSKRATGDIKKVVDLFGGWGSASDFSRKPKVDTINSSTVKDATDNISLKKNKTNQKVADEQSTNPTRTKTSQSVSKVKKQSSIQSENETFPYSVKEMEAKTSELKLCEDIKSVAGSQNSYFNSETNQFLEESSEVQKNFLITDDWITPKISDIPESSEDVSTTSIYTSNVSDHHGTNREPFAELYSLNEKLLSNSSYTHYPEAVSQPLQSTGISKPIESQMTKECVSPSIPATHSTNLSSLATEETSQSNDNKLESPLINSPSNSPPPTDFPSETPINPILPFSPVIGGFINPNTMPGMNPNMMPGLNLGMMPGINPLMVGGMNPLLMQQMLFLTNPFLASQIRAMEMYYRSIGMAAVPQGMFPPQMNCSPESNFNGTAFPNVTDDNCNNTINAPVPPNNCDVNDPVANSNTPVINPPVYAPNNKLNVSLNENIDTSSHILKYDPDDADSLLQQFLEPHDNDKNFIPPPVMPNSRNGNAVSKQSLTPETYNPANFKSGDDVGNKIANAESSWNGAASAKEATAAAVPESTGWGDFDSDGMKSNWNDEIDGWGNENYTLKAMGNPSNSKKRSVSRQPSSQPAFSRYKK